MHKYSKILTGAALLTTLTSLQLISQATPIDHKKGKTTPIKNSEGAANKAKAKRLRSARPIRSMEEGISSQKIKYDKRLGKVIESFHKGNSYLETLELELAEKREETRQTRPMSTNENIRTELALLHKNNREETTAQRLLNLVRLASDTNTPLQQIAWTMYGNPPIANAPNFLGPLDSESLNLGVKGKAALRIIPTPFTPNIIAGNEANITSSEVVGAVISGGGDPFFPNQIHGDYGTVSGGLNNMAGGEFRYLKSPFATVSGGRNNSANRRYSTVSGGHRNTADGLSSVISGGDENTTAEDYGIVAGGSKNHADGRYSTISGGKNNKATGTASNIAGGDQNQTSGRSSSIGGGSNNEASGDHSSIPGGAFNTALGRYSLAAGHQAQARHAGSFVWADSNKQTFQSSDKNQFLIKAQGHVGIDTETPFEKLTVEGNIAPATPSTHSLGTEKSPWKNLHLDHSIHVQNEWRVQQKGHTALRLDSEGNLHVSGKIISKRNHNTQASSTPDTNDNVNLNAAIRRFTKERGKTSPSNPTPTPETLTRTTQFKGAVQGTFNKLELAPKSITPFHLADQSITSAAIANGSITIQDINRSQFEKAFLTRSGGKIAGTLYLPEDGLSVGVNQLHIRDGNVGIGLSEPREKLSVNGSIFATEGILFADGTRQKTAYTKPTQNIAEKMQQLVRETVEKEFIPKIEERIASQHIPSGTAAPAMGVQQDPTTLSKNDLQSAINTLRTELQQTLTAQTQSMKPPNRALTPDEERALIRRAVSEMKQNMERIISNLTLPAVTTTNIVVQNFSPETLIALKKDILATVANTAPQQTKHQNLSRQEIEIITSEFISTIDQRIKEYHPNQIIQQYSTNITQILQETLSEEQITALRKRIQTDIEQRLPDLIPAPIIQQTNQTHIIQETLSNDTRKKLLQELRTQLAADLQKTQPQIITNHIETPLAPEKITALTQNIMSQLSANIDKQIQAIPQPERKLSRKNRKTLIKDLLKELQPQLNDILSATKPQTPAPALTTPPAPQKAELSQQQIDQLLHHVETSVSQSLSTRINALQLQQTNLTKIIQKNLSNKEQTQLMAQIRKDMDQKIAMIKPTKTTQIIREEITPEEKIQLVEAILKQTDARILERMQKIIVTNNISHYYTNTILQTTTNNITYYQTNIIERSFTSQQKNALMKALYEQVSIDLKDIVKPPVIQQTTIIHTNTVNHSYTNTILNDITPEKQAALLAQARIETQTLIDAIKHPQPIIQNTSITNIIERALTTEQKNALMKTLYKQVSIDLKTMVKAPTITENYTTNIIRETKTIRETISQADKENLILTAQQRTLAALPKPKPITPKQPGINNMTATPSASIGGGQENIAAGPYSTIPGGRDNLTKGRYSFATGRRAKAIHDGSFIWADTTDADLLSTAPNQFKIRASGGTRIQSSPSAQSGVTLHTGDHAWSSQSAANTKQNIARADTSDVLNRLAKLPIYTYQIKSQTSQATHLGPHAEDFAKAFGLGQDTSTINRADANAIALASIQALHQMLLQKNIETERSKLQIQRMRNELDNMNTFIKQMRQILEAQANPTP